MGHASVNSRRPLKGTAAGAAGAGGDIAGGGNAAEPAGAPSDGGYGGNGDGVTDAVNAAA
jgi:hypothetical protein